MRETYTWRFYCILIFNLLSKSYYIISKYNKIQLTMGTCFVLKQMTIAIITNKEVKGNNRQFL